MIGENMTVLSYSTEPSFIIGLWVMLTAVAGVGIITGLVCETLRDSPKLTISLIVLFILGIIGLVFWTPYYNVVKVYADDKFSISSIQDKYEIVEQDGYIVTLQEKESIK